MNKISVVVLAFCLASIAPFASADSAQIVNPENGHLYQRFDTPMSWQQARTYCESLGGYLATITSAQENAFVDVNLAINKVWLGGTDENVEGVWEWVSGEPWVYENWAPGEPNNLYPENYLVMYGYGQWNDDQGIGPRLTVCEWPWIAFRDLVVSRAMVDLRGGEGADSFILAGRFTLAADSDGIDLLSESVTVGVGPAAITIPPGALSLGPFGYEWSGFIDGVEVNALFQDRGGDEFIYRVHAHGTDLTGMANPTLCKVIVGNDGGSLELHLEGRLGVGENQLAIGVEDSE